MGLVHWQSAFLRVLADTGNVRAASASAGISRATAYRARKRDRNFADKWDAALDDALEALMAEAMRRALRGVDQPHFYRGKLVGHTKVYSDYLLRFLIEIGMAAREKRDKAGNEVKPAIIELVERLRIEHGKNLDKKKARKPEDLPDDL